MILAVFRFALSPLFVWVWSLSWQAALLIGMVRLAQWLTRRWVPARWRYNLWLLVLVRLLLPFSPESHLSVFNAVRRAPASVNAAASILPTAPTATAVRASTTVVPIAASTPSGPVSEQTDSRRQNPTRSLAMEASPLRVSSPARQIDWWTVAAWAWLAGTILFALYVGWTTLLALRQIRGGVPVDDAEIIALLDRCREQMGVRPPVSLQETTLVRSPALFGVMRPRLLLPPGLLDRFSPAELRYVFLHELAHVRRRDVALNWLLTLLQIIHWFNPVIWWGFAKMRVDRELACDALAMACSDEAEARSYGRTLIKLLEGFTRTTAAPGFVGILENKRDMAQRLQLIARFRRSRRWSWLAMALMAALAVTGLTDAVHFSRAQTPSPTKEKPVRLTVLDAQTGQPVANAGVLPGYHFGVWYSAPPPLLRTDANGIVDLPAERMKGGMSFGVFTDDHAPRAVETIHYSGAPKPSDPDKYVLKLEPGTTIGGTVRDEKGQPLAGVRVSVRATTDPYPRDGAAKKSVLEYPIFDPLFAPGVFTDVAGRWTCARVPLGMQTLQLDFERPDGSFRRFHSLISKFDISGGGEAVDTSAAWNGEFVCFFKPGIDVRGVVVDTAGHPLAGIRMEETDGRHRQQPISVSVTGADGRFVLPNRDPHQLRLTLTGAGLAPRLEVVDVAPKLTDLALTMRPAAALRLRAVDVDDHPVPGMKIFSGEPTLTWQGVTDKNGRVSWDGAPIEPMLYRLGAEGYGPRAIRFAATGSEQTVTLRRGDPPGTLISVHADDESGHPLGVFAVTAAYQAPGGFADTYDRLEPLAQGKDGLCTVIVPLDKSGHRDFRLKVEADGRQAFTSEPILGEEADQELTAVLPKAESSAHSQINLRLPDGAPAAGASVVLNDLAIGEQNDLFIYFVRGGRPRAEGERKKTVRANDAGSVALPAGAADATVIVLHEQGYLFTTLGQLQQAPETTLSAWGRLKGTLTINGHPKSGQRLMLQPHYQDGTRSLSFSLETTTDREGRFEFERAPADEFQLTCTEVSEGEWPISHPTLVQISSGQTAELSYAVAGRTVTGNFRVSPAEAIISWKGDLGDCLLTRQSPRQEDTSAGRPAFEDYVRWEDYRRLDQEFLKTHRYASGPDLHDSYAPKIDANGNFRFEGVPPGNYELRLELRRRKRNNREWQNESLGKLTRSVTVPKAPLEYPETPVALGEMEVAVNTPLLFKREAVRFAARGLDGQAVDLATYSGRPVLLLFWASWAPPSAQTLEDWQSAARAHSDGRLVVIGVTLDHDPIAIKKFAQEHFLPGTQIFLEGGGAASVTEALAIDELPAALLLGPDGKVLARDLAGPRLQTAVDSALVAH